MTRVVLIEPLAQWLTCASLESKINSTHSVSSCKTLFSFLTDLTGSVVNVCSQAQWLTCASLESKINGTHSGLVVKPYSVFSLISLAQWLMCALGLSG